MILFPTISLRVERWKFNKDYGIYVSTLGNFKDRYKRRLPIKIHKGYCYVQTETAGFKAAHRIVMFTWKHIPDAESLTVDHKNHNKRDNSLGNLEWVTQEENLRRASEDELRNIVTIEDNGNVYIIENDKLKKAKQEKRRDTILGYSINNEGCYTKEEVIKKLRILRPNSSLKLAIKGMNALENGTNSSGAKFFGKPDSINRVIVKIIYRAD